MLTTRRVLVEDIPAVRELASRIWHSCYPGIISTAQIEYMLERMFAAAVIHEQLGNGVVWEFIVSDGQPIGFLSFGQEGTSPAVKLHKLYLLPAFHGRGFGSRIIEHVKEEARLRDASRLLLTVNKNNANAIRVYERCGFQIAQSIVTEIGGGYVMDDYVMTVDL